MKKITVKVDQNGGEYYGYTTVKCKGENITKKDGRKIIADDVEIEFDEYIEIISIKDWVM